MALQVVEQYKSGQRPVVKYLLDDETKQLIRTYFVLNKKLNKFEHNKLLSACKRIYEHNHWVQCDCKDRLDKPLFRFKRSSSGKLFLARLTDREPHLSSCDFKESVTDNRQKIKNKKKYRAFTGLNQPLNLLNKRADGISSSAGSKSPCPSESFASRPVHKLAKALYMIIEQGGFNRFSPLNKLPLRQAYKQAVSGIELAKGKYAADYFSTGIKGLYPLAKRLREDQSWPKNLPKQGLILAKATSFKGNTLNLLNFKSPDDKEPEIINITIHNRIYQWSGRFSERTSPFLALILITDLTDKPGFFVPFNAFLMPCYSFKSNMPVDSFYERMVLQALYKLAFEDKNSSSPMEIIKPVLDYEVKDDQGCIQHVLPDFLVKKGNKTFVIEVNGSHNPDYLERKQRTHVLMEKLGHLFVIDAYLAEKNKQLMPQIAKLIDNIRSAFRC